MFLLAIIFSYRFYIGSFYEKENKRNIPTEPKQQVFMSMIKENAIQGIMNWLFNLRKKKSFM